VALEAPPLEPSPLEVAVGLDVVAVVDPSVGGLLLLEQAAVTSASAITTRIVPCGRFTIASLFARIVLDRYYDPARTLAFTSARFYRRDPHSPPRLRSEGGGLPQITRPTAPPISVTILRSSATGRVEAPSGVAQAMQNDASGGSSLPQLEQMSTADAIPRVSADAPGRLGPSLTRSELALLTLAVKSRQRREEVGRREGHLLSLHPLEPYGAGAAGLDGIGVGMRRIRGVVELE